MTAPSRLCLYKAAMLDLWWRQTDSIVRRLARLKYITKTEFSPLKGQSTKEGWPWSNEFGHDTEVRSFQLWGLKVR
jgi:hypothetical protein